MADERLSTPAVYRDVGVPAEYSWETLTSKIGAELEVHYVSALWELANKKGMLGQIFCEGKQNPRPKKTFTPYFMIDENQLTLLDADIKGDI